MALDSGSLQTAISPRFVGRRPELDALLARVGAAGHGEPSLTWVSGEAGIGKSRLLREAEQRARADGALVLHGECLQLSGGEFPYAPLVGALRAAEREPVERALAALPGDGRAEVARLVPELAARHVAAPPPERSEHARARLFELLLGLLHGLGEATPLLLVIEDAHWADTSTRDFLVYLVPNLAHARIAVVASYRVDDVTRRHPLRAIVRELGRRPEVRAVTLGPLTHDEVEAQLDALLERRAEHALVEEIYASAQGNPFYVEELLAARRAGRAGGVDDGTRDTLLTRVDALSEDARLTLQALATVGRPAGEPLLAAVTGIAPLALSRALHQAVDAHVLTRHAEPGGEEGFEFRHALMRDAVAEDLMQGELRALHRAVAEALLATGHANPAELAFHWEVAGNAPAAFNARLEAGRATEELYAFSEAHEHFERALELFATAATEDADRVELIARLAEAKRLLGDCEGAAGLIEQALTLVDPEREPLRVAMLYERHGAYTFWDDEGALADCERALALIPESATAERARLLAARALALHNLTRWEEASEQAQAALALAETPRAHIVLGTALAFLGDAEAGERHARRAAEIAGASDSVEDRAKVFSHLAEVMRMRGDLEGALALMLDGEQTCERLGMSRSFGDSMSVNAAEDLLWLGRWDEATARLERNERLNLRHAARILQLTVAGQIAVARGEADAARRVLERARAACNDDVAPDYRTAMHAGWAELALWEHRPLDALDEVSAHLDEIGAAIHPLYAPVLHSLGCRAAADAALRLRNVQDRAQIAELRFRAERFAAQLDEVTERHGGLAQAGAHLALCHAELERLSRRPAPERWHDAAERWTAIQQPYPAAYAHYREGEALLEQGGHRADSSAALVRARTAAEALGARPLLAAIDQLALAHRVSLAREPDDAPRAASPGEELGLTPREAEILVLVARGHTNRDIAETLVISANTVRVHVSNILAKLDVPRRVDAATAAQRLGLLD